MKKKVLLTILAFMVLLFSGFVHGAIPASERAALITLYNSTNGDNWTNSSGWKTAPLHTDGFAMPGTEGTWFGVIVSGDHVVQVDLKSNQLIGNIPSELGNFSILLQLNLSSNQLSSAIPSQLGNLSGMKWLDLSYNQLSGSIPPQLGNLSILLQLDLGSNQLSGSIPPELGNASNLSWLRLRFNQLSNSIPSQLGNLSNLGLLDLSNNQLSGGIPSELGNLGNLGVFFLGANQLSGAIPASFINLTHIPLNYLDVDDNCLSATDSELIAWLNIHDPDWEANQNQCAGKTSEIKLNRSHLYFGASSSESISNAQTILISNNGSDTLNWSASGNATWLSVTPSSGTGDSALSVSIYPSSLAVGNYTGAIIITDPNATNSPQSITVSLHVYDQGQTSAPFGEFATPLDGASICNSVPVTGWALDDIGVANVKIYNGETYIGEAVLVEGARPDVEATYPSYPNNYKAGWGYMLLTHSLPNGGNGTYTLTAKATDMDGNEIILGSKTITVDNAHAIKPFGAIDTPTQGGTASEKSFVNFGWALTPQPSTIPVDGSTINVVIDGVIKGHPIYNSFRSDVATLFPGYANTNGAGGYYYFDTTKLKNGLHTIAWIVSDTGGNSDGIGSRYFSVMNTGASGDSSVLNDTCLSQNENSPGRDQRLKPVEELYPDESAVNHYEIKELERMEINLSNEGIAPQAIRFEGYLVVGDQLRELPIGSTLDKDRGVFYWQPGPGFLGTFRLVFMETDSQGNLAKKNIWVTIMPRSYDQ